MNPSPARPKPPGLLQQLRDRMAARGWLAPHPRVCDFCTHLLPPTNRDPHRCDDRQQCRNNGWHESEI